MRRRITRSVVLAGLLLLAAASSGVAGATEHGARTNSQSDLHLSIETDADEDGIVLAVAYDGNGSAIVTVSGVNGTYRDATRFEVDGNRTVTLSIPTNATGVAITVDVPGGTVTRVVQYETVGAECGLTDERLRVPTAVHYAWTIDRGDERLHRERTVDLPVPAMPCLTGVGSPGANGSAGGYGPFAAPDHSGNDTDGEERPAFEADDPHERGHDRHDEAHQRFRAVVQEANDTAHSTYGSLFGVTDHAARDGDDAVNRTERDVETVDGAADSLGERAIGDLLDRADRELAWLNGTSLPDLSGQFGVRVEGAVNGSIGGA